MKTLNEWKELLQEKQHKYNELSFKLDNLKNELYDLDDRCEELSDEIDDIKIHIKAGEYGDLGYYILKAQNESNEKLFGYTVIDKKYIISNLYFLISLNDKPPLLKNNSNHAVTSEIYHRYMNLKTENTYMAKTINEYERLDEKTIKIGRAQININYAKCVWCILNVDENSIVKDFISYSRGKEAYSIYIESKKGSAIIMGMKHSDGTR